ncbi:ACT domain-containing protein [Candidatus Woesearchaeota archaeon]|nr:ACT domain-containing protein [Candidatus Woesearchaeota archaeon]
MTNISDKIKVFLDNDFIIRRCLFQNILSLRALSRHIIKEINLEQANMDAVMSAIRRYKKDNKAKETQRTQKIISDVSIKTKDRILDVYLPKNKEVQAKIIELNKHIDFEKGEILRIIQAEQGIRVIIEDKNFKHLSDIFNKKDIVSINRNLTEINIQFSLHAAKTPGIIALISSSLNSENINIVEIMSSAPELIILLDQKDLIKALSTLENLKNIY